MVLIVFVRVSPWDVATKPYQIDPKQVQTYFKTTPETAKPTKSDSKP